MIIIGTNFCVYKMVTIYNSQILNVEESLGQIILFFPNKIKVSVFQTTTKKSLETTGEKWTQTGYQIILNNIILLLCFKVLKHQRYKLKRLWVKCYLELFTKYSRCVLPVQLKTKFKQMAFGCALNSNSKEELLYPSSHTPE